MEGQRAPGRPPAAQRRHGWALEGALRWGSSGAGGRGGPDTGAFCRPPSHPCCVRKWARPVTAGWSIDLAEDVPVW